MPTYKVTSPDGRIVRLTGESPPTDDELTKIFAELPPQETAPSAITAAGEFSKGGMRPKGGYEGPEEGAPEGWFSRTVRGMIHPSPAVQFGMDVMPFASAAAEAAPNAVVRSAQAVRGPATALARGTQRVAGVTADVLEHPVVSSATGAAIGAATREPLGAVEGAVVGS